MDKYLRLTTTEGDDAFVYYDCIQTLIRSGSTLLQMSNDVILKVRESPEEIIRMIEHVERTLEQAEV